MRYQSKDIHVTTSDLLGLTQLLQSWEGWRRTSCRKGPPREAQHKFVTDLIGAVTKIGEDTFNVSVLQEVFTMCKAREILPRREKGTGKGKDKEQAPDIILLPIRLEPLLHSAAGIGDRYHDTEHLALDHPRSNSGCPG